MQTFIKENAMHPQSKKAAQLSCKELLDGLIYTIEESDMLIEKLDERHGD